MPPIDEDLNTEDEGYIAFSYVQLTEKAVAYTVAASDSLNIDYDKDGNAVGFELCCTGPGTGSNTRDIDMPELIASGEKYSRGTYTASFGSPPSGDPPSK